MKALRSALYLMPIALAASTLGGCHAYARAWNAQHAKQYGSRPTKAAKKTDQAKAPAQTEGAVTIVQAGNPREDGDAPEQPRLETKAERARREQAEQQRVEQDRARQLASSQSATAQPATTSRAPSDGRTTSAPAPISQMAASPAAPAPAARPQDRKAARKTQRELDAMMRGSGDAEITAMFLMINDIDISFARLALVRSDNPDVQAFAKRMINDHAQAVANVRGIVEREGIFPADNRLSRDLRDQSAWDRDSLRLLSGRAFDSAYVARQVTYHKELLSMIDDVLLPRAHDGELLRAISTMRPAIAAHLAHAQQLEANLGIRDVSMANHR